MPIRVQFRGAPNVEIHLGHVDGVDLAKRIVFGEAHEIAFDYLILACGARHSYFGHPEWEEFAPGLKTLEQATEMRRRMLVAFERAENERDPDKQRAYLTFVVVGGGPTGVELAGAIADISRTAMQGDFRRIDPAKARIVLLEAAPRVLTAFSDDLSERARRDLTDIGVEVRTNAKVDAIDSEGVTIGTERLAARTVFWAAGVQAERLAITPPLETDRASRIKVNDDYSLPGYANVFVVGDMASLEMSPGQLVPGVAPAAIQAGEHAARMILRDLEGQPRQPFVYNDKGTMATIGKSRAVGQIGRVKLTGRIAWFAWLLIHVYQLIGFRNRLAVIFNWAWNYMFSKRGARLITEKEWKLTKLNSELAQMAQSRRDLLKQESFS